jgi:hypothetical protein
MDYESTNIDSVIPALKFFAIQTHELYSELVTAGFEKEQAISIVVGLATKEQ